MDTHVIVKTLNLKIILEDVENYAKSWAKNRKENINCVIMSLGKLFVFRWHLTVLHVCLIFIGFTMSTVSKWHLNHKN